MEKLGEVIKIFFEKYCISTVCSLVGSAIIYVFTPDEFLLIERLSKSGYYCFCVGVLFILIQFLIWIINNNKEKKESQEIDKFYKKKAMQINLEYLWDFVDSLCRDDINYLKTFLRNNNAPIVIKGNLYFCGNRLFTSNYVKKQEGYDAEGHYIKYILETDFYELLKFSAEEHGKIGHFEEV